MVAAPRNLIAALPYAIHTMPIQFTNRACDRYALPPHLRSGRRRNNGNERRRTKAKHPSANGRVERINRIFEKAMLKTPSLRQPRQPNTHIIGSSEIGHATAVNGPEYRWNDRKVRPRRRTTFAWWIRRAA
jgi:hypothetical protein